MNEATVSRLNAINRRFYDERADEFDTTRERAWQGWGELFDRYGSRLAERPVVLDLGCGNGRFARFLQERLDGPFFYHGVDASELGLAHAAKRLAELPDVHLHRHDFIVEPELLPPTLAHEVFDLVVLFGVVHHIPGREHRASLLKRAAAHLAPNGVLAYTLWRFDRFERFTRKLVPWDDFDVDASQLEPGDYIMTWGDGDIGYRYCHAVSDDEADALERALDLELLPSFLGDNELNRYSVLVKKPPLDAR